MQIYPKFETSELKRLQSTLIILVLFFSLFSSTLFAQESKGKKITTIVLDAGHGGKDPGALGKHSREKDITLKTVLKLGHYLESNLPDVKVIYTRKKDVFVELKKRGEIANKHNADLFISIHCNANPSKKLYGAETYVLGSDASRTNRNMKVAMLENAAILLEEDSKNAYDGFDPNAPESYIIFSLKQNDYKQEQSLILADKIQKQFKNRAGRRDRGVHQAGFLVLAGTYMPSVLVELGYLSNANEERFLMSDKGQSYLASAIYRAVKEYKKEFELENNHRYAAPELSAGKSSSKTSNNNLEYRVQFYTSPSKISLNDKRFKLIPDVSYYYHNGLYKYTSGHFSNLHDAFNRLNALKKKGYPNAWVVKMKNGKRFTETQTIVQNDQPEYRIQFYTSPHKIGLNNQRFKELNHVSYYYHNGLYKYTYGHFKTLQEAKKELNKLRSKGYKDAFIVKMKGNKRIR
jgi:N-acetylmuramoyl-L-alanine amidase